MQRTLFVTPFSLLLASLILVCPAPGLAAWSSFAGDSHHTAVSSAAAQPLEVIHWFSPVDLAPPSEPILIHYGSPLVTPANTVIVPVKTGSEGGYRVRAMNGRNGAPVWTATTDYILPPHNWIPSYSPVLTPSNRLYFPGAGGTVYFRDDPDSSVPAATGQIAFFGTANYVAARASFDATVFVTTPLTSDSAGNIYFGFRAFTNAPLGLRSGIARVGADGSGTWIAAVDVSGGDATITRVPLQVAPVLSNDERTLYVVVTGDSMPAHHYLVGLDPDTLALKESSPGVRMRVALTDPRSGGANFAIVTDDSSASPMVGPDGDVYYGVLGNPFDSARGWMLHFSGNLVQARTPGAFGWDTTASVVPAFMVPSYAGPSSYLIFTKYNDYAGAEGQGVHKIAVLDPNATMVDPRWSSNGLLVMKEILTIAGPTADPEPGFPNAVREWCINTAAVDPSTRAVMANSEDGRLYRWDLPSNALSQAVTLSPGIGEAYTPTVIGPDGTVYAINQAILNAVGRRPVISVNDITVAEGDQGWTNGTFTVSLSSASTQTVTMSYATADGTAHATSDYRTTSGTLTFTPGEITRTVTVLVRGDSATEAHETFFVNVGSPSNATIGDGQGRATILDDDGGGCL